MTPLFAKEDVCGLCRTRGVQQFWYTSQYSGVHPRCYSYIEKHDELLNASISLIYFDSQLAQYDARVRARDAIILRCFPETVVVRLKKDPGFIHELYKEAALVAGVPFDPTYARL